MAESSRGEDCPDCAGPATRVWTPTLISGAKVTHPEYNPGLGCVVKNKRHKEDLCKRRNVVEIGNDFKSPDSAHKHFDGVREAKLRKRWDDA